MSFIHNKMKLKNLKKIKLVTQIDKIQDCNVYIVTVPTPINDKKKPDLKIAGQKVKPTDPLYDKLVAMIPAETRSSIDGLSDYDKGRLKKELSA